jgi:membrane associated rhomboid family serine protease
LLPLKDNIPTLRFPVVTVVLIVLNAAVFVWQLSYSDSKLAGGPFSNLDQSTLEYGAIPYKLTHPAKDCALGAGVSGPRIVCEGTGDYDSAKASGRFVQYDEGSALLTLFMSMFMHGGWLHILGNMLFLWIFGNNIEDSMGRARFILFYVLGGLAAMAAQVAIGPDSTVPTVGASGAIAAVLGGYMLLFPRARVLTLVLIFFFFTLIEIPALVMLGIWLALQFLPAVGQLATTDVGGEGGGVAYFAHIGGFVFGLLMIKLFADRRKIASPEPRLPVY